MAGRYLLTVSAVKLCARRCSGTQMNGRAARMERVYVGRVGRCVIIAATDSWAAIAVRPPARKALCKAIMAS